MLELIYSDTLSFLSSGNVLYLGEAGSAFHNLLQDGIREDSHVEQGELINVATSSSITIYTPSKNTTINDFMRDVEGCGEYFQAHNISKVITTIPGNLALSKTVSFLLELSTYVDVELYIGSYNMFKRVHRLVHRRV